MSKSKVLYSIEVEIEYEDEEGKKAIISRTRRRVKKVIFDSPDAVKPIKIQISNQ